MPLSDLETLERIAGRLAHCVNELVCQPDPQNSTEEILPAAGLLAELTNHLMVEGGCPTAPPRPEEQVVCVAGDAPKTALLAEEGTEARTPVRQMLERLGYEVLEAGCGSDALAICREYPGTICLLLVDVLMPDMSGRELAERAALLHRDLAVIYMSGYASDDIFSHGILGPGAATLGKPVTADALEAKIASVTELPLALSR